MLTNSLLLPHGNILNDLVVSSDKHKSLLNQAIKQLNWNLTPRQLCDLELLINGGFSPLPGFLTQADYHAVLSSSRLANKLLWPIPINLDVSIEFAEQITVGDQITLRHPEGHLLAVLTVEDKWQPDKNLEAKAVYGTTHTEHPGVYHLFHNTHPVYLGGKLAALRLPEHANFRHLRATPQETRQWFNNQGWQKIVAFQTRNPMHRAHVELTLRAMADYQANLLLHPVVGLTKPGDIDANTRIRCYEKLLAYYPLERTCLRLLPLAMRMAGPREALWHAIIRKNYGATHFIVGRDHAGPGKDKAGNDFYSPFAAQELVEQHAKELEITLIKFDEMVYSQTHQRYKLTHEITPNETVAQISGTELRRCLQANKPIPNWYSFPEVIAELRKNAESKAQQGLVIFFTGLSCAGKSTLAKALQSELSTLTEKNISLLDGDLVRKHLSSELSFTKAHRDLNVLRVGYVAAEIARHQGIAICALIAPYAAARNEVREMVEANGKFIEIYVATPLKVCQSRDNKGIYAQAEMGLRQYVTGVDDPYEVPLQPEISIDTSKHTIEEGISIIIDSLKKLNCIPRQNNLLKPEANPATAATSTYYYAIGE